MECLDDFVGLRNVTEGTAASGLDVNALPGISTEMAQSISIESNDDFWQDVQQTAQNRMLTDVRLYLQTRANFQAKQYSSDTAYKRTASQVALTSQKIGQYIILPPTRYGQIVIDSMELIALASGVVRLVILDQVRGDLIDLEEITDEQIPVSEGYNKIDFNITMPITGKAQRLFVGIQSEEGELLPLVRFSNGYANECVDYCNDCEDFYFYPAIANTENDIRQSPASFGVWVNFHFGCSAQAFVCQNRELLAVAYQYALGFTLLDYKINSFLGNRKLNFFSATNLEQTKETRNSFEASYKDRLKTSLDSIALLRGDYCTDCSEKQVVSYKTVLP